MTNAGGLNPPSCSARCGEILEAAGMARDSARHGHRRRRARSVPRWIEAGHRSFASRDRRGDLERLRIGWSQRTFISERGPIAEALAGGARIVLTGRVADASLTLGPAVAHFGWRWDDWKSLAGASAAGHLIECGAQATGGLWHRWDQLADPAGIGYPIAEIGADGSCVITKPDRGPAGWSPSIPSPSSCSMRSMTRACYRTPDVDVDFTGLEIEPSRA